MEPEDSQDIKYRKTVTDDVSGNSSERDSIVGTPGTSPPDYGTVKDCGTVRDKEAKQCQDYVPRTYLTRFWVLGVFCLLGWLRTLLWNTWGPISESMDAAFGWGPSTVATMANWGTLMSFMFSLPMCWATHRFGLRTAVVTAAVLLFLGTSLRCITLTTPTFTIMCHLCAVLVGVVSTLTLSAPLLLAADWFPVQERTTAVAVMFASLRLGGAGSYLEPLIVHSPSTGVSVQETQHDVMRLMYIGAGIAGVLLVLVLVYFPSKPPSPPSVTSAAGRLRILPGIQSLVRNKLFIILLLTYSLCTGPLIAWPTVLDYSLLPLGLIQDKAMWVGLSSVLTSSFLSVVVGRINDLAQGHIRSLLFFLMLTSGLSCYWFLLITYGVLPFTEWQVFVSVVGGIGCNFSLMPLFYEVGQDMAHPVPEILVSGIMTAFDNIASCLFLLVFFIPHVGYKWMTYTLVLSTTLPVLPLLCVKFNYARLNIDTSSD